MIKGITGQLKQPLRESVKMELGRAARLAFKIGFKQEI